MHVAHGSNKYRYKSILGIPEYTIFAVLHSLTLDMSQVTRETVSNDVSALKIEE